MIAPDDFRRSALPEGWRGGASKRLLAGDA